MRDEYSFFWNQTPEGKPETPFEQGRFGLYLEEAELLYKCTGCMFDEEGARMWKEEPEWIRRILESVPLRWDEV
jgi:hypothetical protein